MFSHVSPQKPHKCVLKPSAQGSFFQDDRFDQKHFKVMISLAFCLQSHDFVHIWCHTHFQVTISLACALKVIILYIFGVKCILK